MTAKSALVAVVSGLHFLDILEVPRLFYYFNVLFWNMCCSRPLVTPRAHYQGGRSNAVETMQTIANLKVYLILVRVIQTTTVRRTKTWNYATYHPFITTSRATERVTSFKLIFKQ